LEKEAPTGLPDGIFSNQKSQFELILDGIAMEDVVYFMVLGIFYLLFGMLQQEKSGNPWLQLLSRQIKT
jgi:hypothetical protein